MVCVCEVVILVDGDGCGVFDVIVWLGIDVFFYYIFFLLCLISFLVLCFLVVVILLVWFKRLCRIELSVVVLMVVSFMVLVMFF